MAEAIRAVHVVAGIGSQDGGPAYSVPRLCTALDAAGAAMSLLSVARDSDRRAGQFPHDYAALPGLRASSGLRRALRAEAAKAQIIHNHGLWLMPNLYAGWEARRAHVPLIVAPRGMLSTAALSFSPLKKRAFWTLLQERAIRGVACFHATSEQEYNEIRAFGLTAPVAIIPNGIDIPESVPAPAEKKERILLSLGRIHPKKGLDRLLHAWTKVEPAFPDWRLRVVGPDEGGHAAELKLLAQRLGLGRVSIEGPVYGNAKTTLFAEADLFVLPTLNENFALSVAEALAHGVPVISTKGAPWSRLDSEGCGWWIDHGAEPLAAALEAAMSLPPQTRQAMGEKGRAWMAREFSWNRIAHDMLMVYRWLLGQSPMPATISLR